MKGYLILLAVLVIHTAYGQSSTNVQRSGFERTLQIEAARLSLEALPATKEQTSPKLTLDRVTYSGIAFDLMKKDNPLRLINPFGPLDQAKVESNVVRDLVSNRVSGLRLFTIHF